MIKKRGRKPTKKQPKTEQKLKEISEKLERVEGYDDAEQQQDQETTYWDYYLETLDKCIDGMISMSKEIQNFMNRKGIDMDAVRNAHSFVKEWMEIKDFFEKKTTLLDEPAVERPVDDPFMEK